MSDTLICEEKLDSCVNRIRGKQIDIDSLMLSNPWRRRESLLTNPFLFSSLSVHILLSMESKRSISSTRTTAARSVSRSARLYHQCDVPNTNKRLTNASSPFNLIRLALTDRRTDNNENKWSENNPDHKQCINWGARHCLFFALDGLRSFVSPVNQRKREACLAGLSETHRTRIDHEWTYARKWERVVCSDGTTHRSIRHRVRTTSEAKCPFPPVESTHAERDPWTAQMNWPARVLHFDPTKPRQHDHVEASQRRRWRHRLSVLTKDCEWFGREDRCCWCCLHLRHLCVRRETIAKCELHDHHWPWEPSRDQRDESDRN